MSPLSSPLYCQSAKHPRKKGAGAGNFETCSVRGCVGIAIHVIGRSQLWVGGAPYANWPLTADSRVVDESSRSSSSSSGVMMLPVAYLQISMD